MELKLHHNMALSIWSTGSGSLQVALVPLGATESYTLGRFHIEAHGRFF